MATKTVWGIPDKWLANAPAGGGWLTNITLTLNYQTSEIQDNIGRVREVHSYDMTAEVAATWIGAPLAPGTSFTISVPAGVAGNTTEKDMTCMVTSCSETNSNTAVRQYQVNARAWRVLEGPTVEFAAHIADADPE